MIDPYKLTKHVKYRVKDRFQKRQNWLKRQRVILHQIERGNWMCPKGGTNCGRCSIENNDGRSGRHTAQEEVNVFIDLKTLNNGPHNNKKYRQSSTNLLPC